jgi:hypothetical protein
MTYKVCYWDEIERCQKERDATPEEAVEIDALKEQAPIKERETLYNSIVSATQARLDAFAATRGYDGILSAVSYADSPTTKFKIEGQYCLTQRDATWSALISYLHEVQAGTIPVPSSYADVEPHLPTLAWPN